MHRKFLFIIPFLALIGAFAGTACQTPEGLAPVLTGEQGITLLLPLKAPVPANQQPAFAAALQALGKLLIDTPRGTVAELFVGRVGGVSGVAINLRGRKPETLAERERLIAGGPWSDFFRPATRLTGDWLSGPGELGARRKVAILNIKKDSVYNEKTAANKAKNLLKESRDLEGFARRAGLDALAFEDMLLADGAKGDLLRFLGMPNELSWHRLRWEGITRVFGQAGGTAELLFEGTFADLKNPVL